MAPRGGTYRMANRLLKGRLPDLLAEHRAAGMSWEEIARTLYETGGVEVTGETLRKWAASLGVEPKAVA